MPQITKVHAREVLDSRGKPTVEAEVHVDGRIVGRASVPSGASTGIAEACELRDGDARRYDGLGVRQAVENVINILGPVLLGCDPNDQASIDQRMIDLDGTANKSRLGANAILAISLATSRAAAATRQVPLYKHLASLCGDRLPKMPLPMTNMISGGKHAGGNLDFQDVLIVPRGAPDYPTALEWIVVRTYRRLGKLLHDAGYEGYLVGDEGGYGPRLKSNREAVEYVVRATEAANLRPADDISIAIDVAASHFYRPQSRATVPVAHASPGSYHLATEGNIGLTSTQMIDQLESWTAEFPITSIEDGLAESDWPGWQELTARLGKKNTLIGDDLFATNPKLLRRGIDEQIANAILIKVNQIGTLTETFQTIALARQHAYQTIVSARSGETEDDFLADLAVGTAADYIKIGSITRSERLAKYNRLLRIAEEI